jgi:hypothetical protein
VLHHVTSFDHLVGSGEQGRWDTESERIGSFQVYNQLNFRRLLDRQIGGLFAAAAD